MNDADKRDKEEFRENLRKEFGFSEEQLLREMEEAETASGDDSMFDGVEDRMFQKLMLRKAEEEKREAQGKDTGKAAEQAAEPETKKVVRFGKKKAILSVALVAAFALALGTTAIGGKSYFFKKSNRNNSSSSIVLDNDRNKIAIGKIDEAYKEIKKNLGIQVLKLEYIPENMVFDSLELNEFGANIIFEYNGNKVYFIQEKQKINVSANSESDRDNDLIIHNTWINQDIGIKMTELKNGSHEYNAQIYINNTLYWVMGIIPDTELELIIKNINYYK